MNKKDFSNLEEQIISTVNDAIKAIDVAKIKRNINTKTDVTLEKLKTTFDNYNKIHIDLKKKKKNNVAKYISKRPRGSKSGPIYTVLGISGCAFWGFCAVIFLAEYIFSKTVTEGTGLVLAIAVLFFIGHIFILRKGQSSKERVKRFKMYVRFIGNNNYFLIDDLAKFTKEEKSFIVKDLSKMIDLGMFLQGHIDEDKVYFMLNDEAYNEYLNLKKQEMMKEISEKKLEEEVINPNQEVFNSKEEEIEYIIKVGKNYIEQIKIIEKDICKEEIALKINKLENIATQILNHIEKNNSKTQEINKFINHYLPITIKLISSYKEINNQIVESDNIKSAKIEIEKSIDLINTAFENLLDDLYEDVILDISTDISVLKTLFKEEGLSDNDFKN